MRTLFHILILVSCALSLISCATFVEPKPETITFEQAMSEFGRGLVAAKQAESLAAKDLIASNGQDFRMGLLPSEAEVTFNIIASGKQDGKLYIDLSPIPTSPVVAGKAGAELGTSYSASRGNQITIKFFNIAFSKKTTTKEGAVILEEPTDPELLERVIAILDGQNSTPKGPVVFSPTHVTKLGGENPKDFDMLIIKTKPECLASQTYRQSPAPKSSTEQSPAPKSSTEQSPAPESLTEQSPAPESGVGGTAPRKPVITLKPPRD